MSDQYAEAAMNAPGANARGNTNGATAPGAGMQPAHGVLVIIIGSAVAWFFIGKVFRKTPKAS